MSDPDGAPRAPVHDDWRRDLRRAQRAVLPDGPTVVSGRAPYVGSGGLTHHFVEIVEALRDNGVLDAYLTLRPRPEDEGGVGLRVEPRRAATWAMRVPPVRYSLGWRTYLGNVAFDAAAAPRLPSGEHLMVFNGVALDQFKAARRRGYRSLGLVSANSHLANVCRQHEKARRRYPLERPWGPQSLSRNLAEYEAADVIYADSHYVWDSFVAEGYPPERLRLFPLIPRPQFAPRPGDPTSSTFNVVYVGSLYVHKGVPLLIDSFRRLSHSDLRLQLVGRWGSRGMRRFVETACAGDPRISVVPGDPLPHLVEAGVYVHPSYEEGCPYAPAEAAACGVPLILSEDSAMVTEYVPDLQRCRVVPTGDAEALTAAMEEAYQGRWTD